MILLFSFFLSLLRNSLSYGPASTNSMPNFVACLLRYAMRFIYKFFIVFFNWNGGELHLVTYHIIENKQPVFLLWLSLRTSDRLLPSSFGKKNPR